MITVISQRYNHLREQRKRHLQDSTGDPKGQKNRTPQGSLGYDTFTVSLLNISKDYLINIDWQSSQPLKFILLPYKSAHLVLNE
jgi:hypothetical protein